LSRSRSRRRIGTALAATVALLAPGLTVLTPAATASSPDVVIAEIYGGGGNTGATLTNDFIELQNRGAAPVDVSGWTIQYASATGTSWALTALAGVIAPGSRYLVQLAAGNGGATALPTPDVTGTTALSGTAGKVALATNATACTGTSCAANAGLRDLVGFGTTANGFEGAGSAPAPSNTTSTARAGGDTDNNAADFAAGLPTPENRAASAPAFAASCPAMLATDQGVVVSTPVSATDPQAVVTGAVLSSAAVSGIAVQGFTPSPAAGQPATATLTVAAATPVGSYPVQLTFSTGDSRTAVCTVAVEVRAVQGVTPISAVQGAGPASPLVGSRVIVEAVATSLISSADRLTGVFLQERVADASPATSEGVFVFCGSRCRRRRRRPRRWRGRHRRCAPARKRR